MNKETSNQTTSTPPQSTPPSVVTPAQTTSPSIPAPIQTTPSNTAPTSQPTPPSLSAPPQIIPPSAAKPQVDPQLQSDSQSRPTKSKKPLLIVIIALVSLTAAIICAFFIHDYLENERLDAESVVLKADLVVEFGSELKVSDCLASLQGELVDDFVINTEQLGEQEISFEYINIKNRKRPAQFTIDIIDTVKPSIFGGDTYTVYTGYEGELTDLMLSVDDIDDRPTREVTGNYNLKKPGTYSLKYVITDASGNQTTKPFTLIVTNPPEDASEPPSSVTERTPISRVLRLYQNEQTRIGIDVSQWQGEIDWGQVKQSGVEFAMLRIGYQYGFGGENVLDPYFKANLDGAKSNHIPVGVYYYSYARTLDEARSQAEWIIDNLGDAELELGIALDWENWATFNSAKMSLYTINKIAEVFFSVVKDADYKPILYSSKNYLDRIWQPEKLLKKFDNLDIWLAQYYDYVTYRGSYQIWQMTDSGSVPGIDGPVDLDIMYKAN